MNTETSTFEQTGFLGLLKEADIARFSDEELTAIAWALSVGLSKSEYEHAQEMSLIVNELAEDAEGMRTLLEGWKNSLQKDA